ncbi:MAG: outer membrane protein assembly factor BamA [Chthoniobacterales bacterium]|nr:outer membrane protein assembly factor BamA [Chthoniobacterales bacterium]
MIFRALLSLALLAFLAMPSIAQMSGPPTGPVVKAVVVDYVGPETISRERVLANLKTKVGDAYSDRLAEEDVKTLFATGDVANVRIFAQPQDDGVKVTVLLQGRSVITEVLIEGATVVSPDRLRKELTFKVGDRLSEEQVEKSRQAMVELYQDRNYGEASITAKVQTDERTGDSRVVYTVSEGTKQVVKRISFNGNDSVLAKDLRKAMKTKTASLLSILNKSGRLVPAQLQEDRDAIRGVYQNRGFADVQITDVQVVPISGSGIELVYTVTEGPQYSVAVVGLDGVNVASADELKARLKMTDGSLFTPDGMTADMKTLRDFYGTQGYIEANIIPEVSPVGPGQVNLTYRIDEGSQSYVNLINIQGNTQTKDHVIRRELAVAPGDVYDTVLVDVSKQRLENLNYFSQVQAVPTDTMIPGRKDLNVIVEEKRTGSFNFGAGFSTIDSLVGFAELQQTNFDLFGWPNFVGGGQRLRIRAQYGIERADAVISLTEPWFLGQQLSLGTELFYREASFLSPLYNQSNYGSAIQLRKPFGQFLAANVEYKLEGVDIFDISNDAPVEISSQEGTYTRSAVSGGLTWDSRDNLFLTRRGTYLNLTGFVAGGGLGGDVQDYGISLEGSQHVLLPWDFIFMFRGQLATVSNWGGSDDVPIFDRLFLGGANNLRGFDFREVGPNADGDYYGGNSLGYMTFELTFPVMSRVRGALFTDWGFVNSTSWNFDGGGYNADYGLGIRLDLPIGPIRIDYGIPFVSDAYNGGSGKIQFNIGYQF